MRESYRVRECTRRRGRMVVKGMVILALTLAPHSSAVADNEEALKEVEERIVALAAKHSSMAADVVTRAEWNDGDIRVRIEESGTYEYQRAKNTVRFRREVQVQGFEAVGDEQTPIEQSELTICDGRHMYTLTEQEGVKSAVKRRVDPRQNARVDEEMFKRWHKEYDLTLLAPVTLGGRDAWVIDAKSKTADKGDPWHDRFFFDKSTGVMLRNESLNASREPVQSHEYRNVRVDVELDPSRFDFTLPEGVHLVDHSGGTTHRRR